MDSNNTAIYPDKKPTVYVAFCGSENHSSDVIGVFSDKYSAIDRCMSEPTYTRQSWSRTQDSKYVWTNGHGRYVKVVEYLVE